MAKKIGMKPAKKSPVKKSPAKAKALRPPPEQIPLPGVEAVMQSEREFARVWLDTTAKLTPPEQQALKDYASRYAKAPPDMLIEGLRHLLAHYAKQQQQAAIPLGALPRHAKLSKTDARAYAPYILQTLPGAVKDGHDWIRVDFNTRIVQSFAKHPGTAAKVILLDVRADKVDEWRDMAGNFTLDSVLANLLGYARPVPPPPPPPATVQQSAL